MPDHCQNRPVRSSIETPASDIPPPTYRQYIPFFGAATFFFWTALYLYVPILPVYTHSIGASLSMVGAVVASYAIPQLLFRIPIGVLFDTLTRRKSLLAGGIITASLGALGLGLAPNPWFLFLARTVAGVGAATWVTFTVYFTAYYPPDDMRQAIGILNFVQGTALVVATYCGGVVAEVYGYSHTFFGAAGLGIVALLALLLAREPVIPPAEKVSWRSFSVVVACRPLLLASFMGLLVQFANWAGLFGFIPVYAAQIGASSSDLGIITMVSLAASAVAALGTAHLARRRGNPFTILLGSVLMGSAILMVPLVHEVRLLKGLMVINGLGRGLLGTLFMSLSIQAISRQQRATAMGIYQATYAVGMLLGPLVSGLLANSVGLATVFYLSAFLCLVVAGMAYLPINRR